MRIVPCSPKSRRRVRLSTGDNSEGRDNSIYCPRGRRLSIILRSRKIRPIMRPPSTPSIYSILLYFFSAEMGSVTARLHAGPLAPLTPMLTPNRWGSASGEAVVVTSIIGRSSRANAIIGRSRGERPMIAFARPRAPISSEETPTRAGVERRRGLEGGSTHDQHDEEQPRGNFGGEDDDLGGSVEPYGGGQHGVGPYADAEADARAARPPTTSSSEPMLPGPSGSLGVGSEEDVVGGEGLVWGEFARDGAARRARSSSRRGRFVSGCLSFCGRGKGLLGQDSEEEVEDNGRRPFLDSAL